MKKKNEFLLILKHSTHLKIGLITVIFFILMATVMPYIFPLNLESSYAGRYLPPSWEHWFGTDFSGRDTWAMIVHGSRDVLLTSALAGLFAVGIGVFVGAVAGLCEGIVDLVLTRIVDVLLTLPTFAVMMILAAVFRATDPISIGLLLAMWSWAGLARSVRNQVLSIKTNDYVRVSRLMNIPIHTIVFNDIVPNMMSYVLLNFITIMRGALSASIGLMMLGLIPYSPANWGMMLNLATGQSGALYIPRAIWYVISPMLMIILFQFGTLQLANGLEEVFNPRLRQNQ